jgi:hypothetical protein
MVGYLDAMFGTTAVKRAQKRLQRVHGSLPEKDRDSMRRWFESKKVDAPLLALYMQLKKEVTTRS